MKAAILSAGRVPHEIAALFRCTSVGLIPINGKPLIALQLEFLKRLGASEVCVALRRDDLRLSEYLKKYSRLFEVAVRIVQIGSDRGPGGTMLEAVRSEDLEDGVFVLLGDTLLEENTTLELGARNAVFTAPVEEAQRWCMVTADAAGEVANLADKPPRAENEAEAAIGCYWFGAANAETWKELSGSSEKRVEISYILDGVRRSHGLQRESVHGWLDCGNADLLVATRRRMIMARSFNRLTLDEVRGTVRKHSTHSDKFRHEINYYRLLPDDLAVFFPRLISFETSRSNAHVELEYYAYPTISEVYIYEEYGASYWSAVIQRLREIMAGFAKREVDIRPADCAEFYNGKLARRLEECQIQHPMLADLAGREELRLNGTLLRGVPKLLAPLQEALSELSKTVRGCVIHGDLCFANILLEPLNKTIRFIDPRGSFHEVGIFGDPRYDAAKLWHSVDGGYDAIINDLFNLKIDGGGNIQFDRYEPPGRVHLLHELESVIPEWSSRREVRLIEGSLFLSMAALHADHPLRQQAMLVTGLEILNQEL